MAILEGRPRSAARIAIGVCAVGIAMLLAPATGHAASTIGSSLLPPPSLGEPCPNAAATCTTSAASIPGRQVQAPFDGVIVRFALRTDGTAGAARLRTLRPGAGGVRTATGSTGALPIAGGQTLHGFNTQLPIKAGELIGIDRLGGLDGVYAATPGASAELWGPPLAANSTAPPDAIAGNRELLLQATIEPDLDNDGFGDETQDACRFSPAIQNQACPGPIPLTTLADALEPRLDKFTLRATRFRTPSDIVVSPTSRRARAAGKKKAPTGSAFTYKLSEPATLFVTILQEDEGLLKGSIDPDDVEPEEADECVRSSRGREKRIKKRIEKELRRESGGKVPKSQYKRQTKIALADAACEIVKRKATINFPGGKAGSNVTSFDGVIGNRVLSKGRYRAIAVAQDGAGNISKGDDRVFKIVGG